MGALQGPGVMGVSALLPADLPPKYLFAARPSQQTRFFAIFGDRAAAGLYGPCMGITDACAVAVSDMFAVKEVAAAVLVFLSLPCP